MKRYWIYIWGITFLFAACNSNRQKQRQNDTPSSGTIYISVDESFKPVIEQEIEVYHSSYPETNIVASYKSEADCFRDLQKDSTRMIIVARGLTKDETSYYEGKLYFQPQFSIMAYDAVAVIVNIHNPDSVFTLADLKNILSGKKNIMAVMDGRNATSTVRYLKDSLLKGGNFGSNVVAAKGSKAVVDVISKDEHAIGLVGLSWVGDVYEPEQQANLKKIRLGLVECTTCEEKDMYAKPSQATITYAQYPLTRPLYYILKENATALGTGFTNFMTMERGQLIFRRACLVPNKMSFNQRFSKIKEQE